MPSYNGSISSSAFIRLILVAAMAVLPSSWTFIGIQNILRWLRENTLLPEPKPRLDVCGRRRWKCGVGETFA
jgi:hypothetical protein